MDSEAVILLLSILLVILIVVIIWQRTAFKNGIQRELRQMGEKLSEILETDSDEKVMVFTSNRELAELSARINELLIDRQKIKAGYRREKISSKKMLSNISHDIKTPLTVVLGCLEIMRMNDRTNEMLEKTEAKAKQVMDLINEFFTLAKLEAGDMQIASEKLNINEVCRENVLDFYELLSQKGFSVNISIPEKAIEVQGDSDAVHRILFNLISNVIRYGSDGKYLELALYEDRTFACIDVTDRGKGIEKEAVPHVFDRLYTLEDSRNRGIQGNGLGLTIAKSLAEQMGGDILLHSEPNVRTTFTIKLKKFVY